jgi:hypothetical protein
MLCWLHMVRIKHTARPINIRVTSETESMASEEALEVSVPRGEALADATSSQKLEDSDDCEGQSGNIEDTESASDDSEHVKIAARATTVGITYDFGVFGVGKACIASMENNTCYFPKGYC